MDPEDINQFWRSTLQGSEEAYNDVLKNSLLDQPTVVRPRRGALTSIHSNCNAANALQVLKLSRFNCLSILSLVLSSILPYQ